MSYGGHTSAPVAEQGVDRPESVWQPQPGTELSAAEKRALAARAQGYTDQGAADVLGVSINTVKTNLKRARLRLSAKNTAHALGLAIATRQLPAGVALPPTVGGGELS